MQPQDKNGENKTIRPEEKLTANMNSGLGLNPEKNLILTDPGEREKLIRTLIEDST